MSAPAHPAPMPVTAAPSGGRSLLRSLVRSPTVVVGSVVVAFWVFCALAGELIAPRDPFTVEPIAGLLPPSGDHLFGTDSLGRDVFSRVLLGARDILTVAPLATLLGVVAGTALGLLMGYRRGLVDAVTGRLVDAVLALPTVVVALMALTAFGPSNQTVILVIGFVFSPYVARTVRTAVLAERELEYVEAARVRGEGSLYIMFVEILPNVAPLVLVEASVRLGYAIFAVATLSFIGFGIQPPSPDWGLSIFESYGLINGGFWWPTLFPAMAIASLVISVNLVADGISEALER